MKPLDLSLVETDKYYIAMTTTLLMFMLSLASLA